MNILGISGIEGTVAFKRRHWPGLDEREYRISQGHDSAAALVVDGEVVAAVAEERINRRKHTGEFPKGAIRACLDQAAIQVGDLDEVVHGFDYEPYQPYYSVDPISTELYREVLGRDAFGARVRKALPEVPHERVKHVDHHLAHAASAYFTSGWDQCLVIVMDGMGEVHGATVYLGADGVLRPVHRLSARNSIGILYSIVTLHLGFEFNSDEYKVMGLAPYGDARRFRGFFDEMVTLCEDGSWDIALTLQNKTRDEHENHVGARRYLAERLILPRAVDADILAEHEDVAAALQACLDRAVGHLCTHFGKQLGARRLALAGGVALNTTANAKLLASEAFEEIYVQPAAADDGAALGAALQRAALAGQVRNRRSPPPFYGPAPTSRDIDSAVANVADWVHVKRFPSLDATCNAAAGLIAAGEVVAWYRGRMEFGPRALGHRSILADPGRVDMRDRVNALVKMREGFRPFAPAVSQEQAARWFEVPHGAEFPYMNVNAMVRAEHRQELPATTHVDGSARIQTVSQGDNPDFHCLLRAVGRSTGREVLLNTSFNVKGQPIVNTAAEAVETFMSTGIGALFLGDILIQKR